MKITQKITTVHIKNFEWHSHGIVDFCQLFLKLYLHFLQNEKDIFVLTLGWNLRLRDAQKLFCQEMIE